jgi:MFS family permease
MSVTLVPSHGDVQRGDLAGLMIALAFLAQNMAVGLGFGAYGTLVETVQKDFTTTRALAASALSVMALAMGLLAPVVGNAMKHWRLRYTMMAGALLCAIGYATLAFVTNIYVLLAVFAVLIGPGACLLGPLPASTLVSNWVSEKSRGRALGFVNMPLFVCIFPFVTARVLNVAGLSSVFLLLAALMAALVPLLMLIVDRPTTVAVNCGSAEVFTSAVDNTGLLRRPAFLILALGSGLIVATGMTMVTHIVSIGLDRGIALPSASLLLSAFGISGAGGAYLFGWLADRASVRIALATVAFLCLPALVAIIQTSAFLPLLLSAALLGLCTSSITGLQGTAIGAWLGKANFSRAMGLVYLFQVPFLFGAAPLAGFLFDRTGSYRAAILLNIATLGATGLMFLCYRPKLAPA